MANPTETVERRALLPFELRQDDEAGTISVVGYAAKFDEEAVIAGQFREIIKPGAFTDAIGRDDVLFLMDHEGLPLARTAAENLRLAQDKDGLRIEADFSTDDPDAQRLAAKVRSRTVSHMSFAFRLSPDGQEWDFDQEDKLPLRTINEVAELIDVSAVGRPAYEGTSIDLRALQEARSAKEAAEQEVQEAEADKEAKRLAAELRVKRLKRMPDLKARESALAAAQRRIGA